MVSAHKNALERLWCDRCSLIVRKEVTDPTTKLTAFVEITAMQDQPCKLSFETMSVTSGDATSAVSQSAKLFLASEWEVPPGSKCIITRPSGAVTAYAKSGQASVFTHHQEIRLELFRGWA